MKYILVFATICYILYSLIYAKENRGATKKPKGADTRITLWLFILGVFLLIAFALV